MIEILLAVLVVIVIYLVAKWVLAKLHIAVDEAILQVGALILLILILLGRVNIGI